MEKMARAQAVQGILSDADIAKELARLRDRNLAAELATQKVQNKARRENHICRLRYEKQHRQRVHQEVMNSLAHLKVFGGRYDNSPFRHDIVSLTQKREAKKRAEAKQDAIYQATYDRLNKMTGTADKYIARLVEPKVLEKFTRKDIQKEVMRQKRTTLDKHVLQDELNELKYMVEGELDTSLDMFPVLEKQLGAQPRARDKVIMAKASDYATAYLAGTPMKPGSPSPASPNRSSLQNGQMKRSFIGTPDPSQSELRPDTGTQSGPHSDTYAYKTGSAGSSRPHSSHAHVHSHVHKPVLAGSAAILVVGADGLHHATHGNYDELEGKVDHHLHIGNKKWDAEEAHASAHQHFSHHNVMTSHGTII